MILLYFQNIVRILRIGVAYKKSPRLNSNFPFNTTLYSLTWIFVRKEIRDLGRNFLCIWLQFVGFMQNMESIEKSYYKMHYLENADIDLEDPEAVLEDPDPPDHTR